MVMVPPDDLIRCRPDCIPCLVRCRFVDFMIDLDSGLYIILRSLIYHYQTRPFLSDEEPILMEQYHAVWWP